MIRQSDIASSAISSAPAPDRPGSAVVTGMASACPPSYAQDQLWDTFFARHYSGSRWARKVFDSAGIDRRHCVTDPAQEDLSNWSTGQRMERYVEEAVPLAAEAVAGALNEAGLAAGDVGLLAVVSCTGYATPGVDLRVAAQLGFSDDVQRLFIGHMGCYAALPGMGAVSDYVVARGRPAVLVCVELSTLHIQPPTADFEQLVAHALFSDGAAAVTVEPGPASGRPASPGAPGSPLGRPSGGRGWLRSTGLPDRAVRGPRSGLVIVDVAARTDVTSAALMTWEVTDLGFRMGLSRRVPDVLARQVGPMVDDLLARNDVDRSEVQAWAVHPGGPRILDVVSDRLGLAEDDLAESRRVLADHGNCSSATVLLVLDEVRARPLTPGDWVVTLAFGPGLTLYAALLQAT